MSEHDETVYLDKDGKPVYIDPADVKPVIEPVIEEEEPEEGTMSADELMQIINALRKAAGTGDPVELPDSEPDKQADETPLDITQLHPFDERARFNVPSAAGLAELAVAARRLPYTFDSLVSNPNFAEHEKGAPEKVASLLAEVGEVLKRHNTEYVLDALVCFIACAIAEVSMKSDTTAGLNVLSMVQFQLTQQVFQLLRSFTHFQQERRRQAFFDSILAANAARGVDPRDVN